MLEEIFGFQLTQAEIAHVAAKARAFAAAFLPLVDVVGQIAFNHRQGSFVDTEMRGSVDYDAASQGENGDRLNMVVGAEKLRLRDIDSYCRCQLRRRF